MADELITSADKLLSTIPVVQAYSCGEMLNLKLWPAATDFTIGLYVGFKNADDATLYHMVLNMDKMEEKTAAAVIVHACGDLSS